MAFRKDRKLPANAKRDRGIKRPHALDSTHSVDRHGHITLRHRALEYREEGPSIKRQRHQSLHDGTQPAGLPWDDPEPAAEYDHDDPVPPVTLSHSPKGARAESLSPAILPAPPSSIISPPPSKPTAAGKPKAKRDKTTPSSRIAQWLPQERDIIRCLLRREVDPLIGKTCSGPDCSREANVRCLECGAHSPLCESCCVQRHRSLYFHCIDRWNGSYFERVELSELGLVIYLGHRDEIPCPNIPTKDAEKPQPILITHTNGLHHCKIQYCHCAPKEEPFFQLIAAGLWPATQARPESAFTEQLMKTAHLDWCISHKSAQDYFRVLARLTNNSDVDAVDDRYREFMFASRMWKHFAMVKRSGRHHKIALPHRDPSCIAVPCFTCPWPDVNLPDDWEQTPKHLQYIYRILLSCDGNFSLHKKAKNDDVNDMSLAPGHSFFIDHSTMTEALKKKYPGDDFEVTCSGFKAGGRAQRSVKFRFLEVSGIIAVTCRHILFRSGAVVDMQCGESYLHADFANAGALRGTEKLKERALTYDIICIYLRNIRTRFKDNFPEMLPIIDELMCLLPLMHMYAHKDLCQLVYALAYSSGFGLAHGEGVETPWAEFNIAGLPTREMSGGARHDAINVLFGYWNWNKAERMHRYLSRKLSEAYAGQQRSTKYFAGLTALAGVATVAEWLSLSFDANAPTPLTFKAKEAAFANSPFLVNLPSAQKAYEDLIEDVRSAPKTHAERSVSHLPARKGLADFLLTGIHLETQLLDLRDTRAQKQAKAKGELIDEKTLSTGVTWTTWRRSLDRWRLQQNKHMPLLGITTPSTAASEAVAAPSATHDESSDDSTDSDSEFSKVDPLPVETGSSPTKANTLSADIIALDAEVIGLPSDFSADDRKKYELELLAEYELRIRIGQAFDQLEVVRKTVKHFAAFIEEKKENARGQKANTRANDVNRYSEVLRTQAAMRYNHIYDRIVNLRGTTALQLNPSDPAANLRCIDLKLDLTISSLKKAREQGDQSRAGSWIWWAFEDVMDLADASDNHDNTGAKPHIYKPRARGKDVDSGGVVGHGLGATHSQGKQRADRITTTPPDEQSRTYSTWFDRAQWFRAWQEKLRHDEAVNIICADFRATIRGFKFMSEMWRRAAESTEHKFDDGERAYAREKQRMFARKSKQCQETYDASRKPGVPADQLDQTLSLRKYLDAQGIDDLRPWEDVLARLRMG